MVLIDVLYFQNSSGGDSSVCCGGFIFIIVVIIFIAVHGAKDHAKAQARQAQILGEAKAAYQDSLTQLKADPTNSNLRETTLHFGRTYSNLTRNNKGVTIFDEVALSNDINAACGGATRLTEDKKASPPSNNWEVAKVSRLEKQWIDQRGRITL